MTYTEICSLKEGQMIVIEYTSWCGEHIKDIKFYHKNFLSANKNRYYCGGTAYETKDFRKPTKADLNAYLAAAKRRYVNDTTFAKKAFKLAASEDAIDVKAHSPKQKKAKKKVPDICIGNDVVNHIDIGIKD